MTKREVINAMLNDSAVAANADYVAYLKNEIKLLDKKNAYASKRVNKKQEANEALKDTILNVLKDADKAMTATEIAEAIDVSVNKASAMLKQLKEDNSIVKEVVKRKSYFSIA